MYTVLEYQLSKNLEQVEDLCYITSMISDILTQGKIKIQLLASILCCYCFGKITFYCSQFLYPKGSQIIKNYQIHINLMFI